ncbi:MAG TPA: tRNA pseudouridine(38-40) synthase TruA [Ignavibacteria bacterium]|nr:tRNA pseudouridine(38-40) synthase TruA [Ignavibacteria bacterium]
MYNYKLVIEYDGRGYKGWQKQNYTGNTIQQCLESSIEKILKEKIKLIGAGRTDAGVSAYNQVANFHFKGNLVIDKFRHSLNSLLPGDITIKNVKSVNPEFHSRYSALKREYIYKISFRKRSIGRDEFYRIGYELDMVKIDEFIEFISKQLNFRSFCKNSEDRNNFLCRIFHFSFKYIKARSELIFTITANRFLHSMVRSLIGCAIDTGRGKLNLKDIKEKTKKGEKTGAYFLPSNALFLNKIYY